MNKEELIYIIKNKSECEYVEYKDSFYSDDEIGEYISALSNGAALRKQKYGYLIWGVDNKSRKLTNTKFIYDREVNGGESYSHYLSRNLGPSIDVEFKEELIDGCRVVYLEIPAANDVITDYKYVRYIRVGSSKEEIRRFPKIEKKLWNILNGDEFSVYKNESPRQDLTFKIFTIYLDAYNIAYTKENMFSNNNMLTENGKFNWIAYMFSDQFNMSFKVVKFAGTSKMSEFVFRKEFGNCCVLKAIDDLINYMETVENIVRSYFDGMKSSRRDEFLFNKRAFKEAYVNAVLHNDWSTRTGPSVFLFKDHLEIFSYGTPLSVMSKDEFLIGTSKPINPELAETFTKFEKYEQSGRGVTTILEEYNKSVFDFSFENSFTVSFKYNKLAFWDEVSNNDVTENVVKDVVKNVTKTDEEVLIELIKKRPTITINEMSQSINKTTRTVQRIIKSSNRIVRRKSRYSGFWEIINEKENNN
ncbi:MAG: hypothetical protein E7178_01895 [Erysipelotrichaceae bacterium]|jgi:predicted HTH transcriptional regulator|nr:hypothetical protein [Erysipelotrichaceae bacterium]